MRALCLLSLHYRLFRAAPLPPRRGIAGGCVGGWLAAVTGVPVLNLSKMVAAAALKVIAWLLRALFLALVWVLQSVVLLVQTGVEAVEAFRRG